MPVKRFRRSRWTIDTDVQVRLSIRLALCLVGYLALFCAIALAEPLATLLGFQVTELTRDAASKRIVEFSGSILTPLLFAVAGMLIHGAVLLHRLAAPVFRMRQSMGALLNRDLTDRVHLPDHDYLRRLAETHNHAVEGIRSDLSELETEIDAIIARDPDDEARNHAEAARKILDRYRLNAGDWAPKGGVPNDAILPEPGKVPTSNANDNTDREKANRPAHRKTPLVGKSPAPRRGLTATP